MAQAHDLVTIVPRHPGLPARPDQVTIDPAAQPDYAMPTSFATLATGTPPSPTSETA